jgi:SAM-dependent methyltransferase
MNFSFEAASFLVCKSGNISTMNYNFTNRDAAFAKFKFLEFREKYGVRFDYKYEVSDAALKYFYVLSQIEIFMANKNKIRLLEVGCGSGHLIKIISKIFNIHSEGFDPILVSRKFRAREALKLNRVKNCKLWPLNNLEFEAANKNKFDLIIDLCAATHFIDSNQFDGDSNSGWNWLAKFSKKNLNNGGMVISATDTLINSNSSKEFLLPGEIFAIFEKTGFKISNISELPGLTDLNSSFSNEVFLRYGRPFQEKVPIELAVLGFVAKN